MAVTIIIISIMVAYGWRPDIDEEIEAFKRAPAVFHRLVFAVPFVLFGFALWAMGINKNTAKNVTFGLALLVIGVLWFRSYKKRGEIKKLENELTKEPEKGLTSKPKDDQKQSYKKGRARIKELENELTKELEKRLTSKPKDDQKQ